MFTEDGLRKARQSAEKAVADMADGELKTAAFTVILTKLLSETAGTGMPTGATPRAAASGVRTMQPPPKTEKRKDGVKSRVLTLKAEGFFSTQRGLNEVREELRKHGWHHPLTALSGTMQGLVQDKELRREQVADGEGKKKVWKYANW